MTGKQCKAARALLGWNHHRLAKGAGVDVRVVTRYERGDTTITKHLRDIQLALEDAGIRFIGQTGVDLPE